MRYLKTAGEWTRYTLAFMHYCQWDRKHGVGDKAAKRSNRPLSARKYHVWPVIEKVERGAIVMFTMNHYTAKDAEGNVHVSNVVGVFFGQHHVHTPADFERWAKDVDKKSIKPLEGLCDCGLKPGECKHGAV